MRPGMRAVAGILTALTLAGCMGGPTRPASFYVLSTDTGTTLATPQPISLGLGPVNLPDLLDRPQIVTSPDPNRIDLAEYERWGGDLNQNLSQVLAQDLMQRLTTDNVVLYPWSGSSRPAFEVSIDFFRFDGVSGQAAQLQGTWRLLDARQGCDDGPTVYRFGIEEPVHGPDYHALVSAMSRGVGRLSDEIAQRIAAASTAGCVR